MTALNLSERQGKGLVHVIHRKQIVWVAFDRVVACCLFFMHDCRGPFASFDGSMESCG